MKFKIRPIKAADFSQIQVIDEAIQREYRGSDWDLLTTGQKNDFLAVPKNSFEIYLSHGFSFVASDVNGIVGFVMGFIVYKTGYIHHIAVLPAYRRNKIALRLYEKLITEGRNQHLRNIVAHINFDNYRSIMLHKRYGFILREKLEADYIL